MLPTGFLGFCRRVSLLFLSRDPPPGPSCGQVLIESFFLANVFEIFRCRQGSREELQKGRAEFQRRGARNPVTPWTL